MQLSIKEILNANAVLKAIIDNDKECKIDSVLKFKILGILKQLESTTDNFNTVRNDLVMKYGKADDDGNIQVSKNDNENYKKFSDELDKLAESKVDVNVTKLKSEEMFKLNLSADLLIKIFVLMEE